MATVLIVEPDRASREHLDRLLSAAGHAVLQAISASEALRAVKSESLDLVLTELRLPDRSGTALLREINDEWPGLPVVVIAADSTVSEAIDAMRAGAADCLTTALEPEEISFVLGKALTRANRQTERPAIRPSTDASLIGEAPSIREMREKLKRLAASNATVLIRGESGTGKELVARAVHDASPRRSRPLVKIDCTSLPETLLESELFGYEKGAFTGAVARKPGRVELADGGTLFLDEIGDLPLPMQAKILRLLQDREFERLGSRHSSHVDARFVCATHRDLDVLTANKEFREDLFYRLNVAPLWLPPLRSRRSDIDLLVSHFISRFSRENGLVGLTISKAALALLRAQRWPGNVRQLENFVERLALLCEGTVIELAQVQRELMQRPSFETQSTGLTESSTNAGSLPNRPGGNSSLASAARAAEAQAIKTVLSRAAGNRTVAARLLGISRATLYNKLRELGIPTRDERAG
jgi:two-component system response regulator AtoC